MYQRRLKWCVMKTTRMAHLFLSLGGHADDDRSLCGRVTFGQTRPCAPSGFHSQCILCDRVRRTSRTKERDHGSS